MAWRLTAVTGSEYEFSRRCGLRRGLEDGSAVRRCVEIKFQAPRAIDATFRTSLGRLRHRDAVDAVS